MTIYSVSSPFQHVCHLVCQLFSTAHFSYISCGRFLFLKVKSIMENFLNFEHFILNEKMTGIQAIVCGQFSPLRKVFSLVLNNLTLIKIPKTYGLNAVLNTLFVGSGMILLFFSSLLFLVDEVFFFISKAVCFLSCADIK